ncbi:rhomboid family intramembrane serine protease [Poriferisphaera sp. WC338]|uniref:rhomboid family intramembrane serine protease n=1 Tax=Poriferisphaera sp. WC338 TaxID=3425129 RepID=UPI003D815754
MFLIFPVKTDRPSRKKPWVNYALIAANIVIYLLTFDQIAGAQAYVIKAYQSGYNLPLDQLYKAFPVTAYYLRPDDLHVYQFFTSAFLHQGIYHIFGNMIFLYVFGNNVEDRLGHVGYLFFYLAAGVVSGLGHAAFEASPALGASGAIAGVTGAFLALFPLANITLFYWVFFIIDYFEVAGIILILFRVIQDFIFNWIGTDNVAYVAHLSGYLFGFALCMALLMIRLFPREPYDMLALIERRRRQAQFKRMAAGGYSPWESQTSSENATDPGIFGRTQPDQGQDVPHTFAPEDQALVELRAQISAAISQHDMTRASRLYIQLMEMSSEQVMSQQHQLDIANQLMADARYDAAAQAYELFLKVYSGYADRHHVMLILGLIYARYLTQPERAKTLLEESKPRLRGSEQELAEQVLKEISGD